MMPSALFGSDRNTDQVIEVTIRKSFDIEKHWRALDSELRITDDMYFLLADRKSFQGMVIFLRSRREPLRSSTTCPRSPRVSGQPLCETPTTCPSGSANNPKLVPGTL